VSAFNGDICVGARQWDTSLCGGGICEAPVMGDDGNEWTEGYMQSGGIPTFKIYDASADIYYVATPSEEFPWFSNGMPIAEILSANVSIPGCTNPDYCNYNPLATEDDGSCDPFDDSCLGCTDEDACNYSTFATIDNGSCYYEGIYDCAGNCIAGVDCDGECSGDAVNDNCGTCDNDSLTDCYDLNISLHEGANLISFPCLPEDVSVANIFAGCDGVIGEGVGAVNIDGEWVGSLTEVSQDAGYWVKVSEDTTIEIEDCEPVSYDADGDVVYDMHYMYNLISYPFITSQYIADALGDAASNIYALAGEGMAAIYSDDAGAWVGSLTAFESGNGYWLVATDNFSFSFNSTDVDGYGIPRAAALRAVPEVYSYRQSDQQAFFFVNNATIRGEALESEDVVIAYNGDVVVGSRYWNGEFTDIPAIGVDTDGGQMYTGYCKAGDKITFKVLDASTGSLVDMDVEGDVMWNNMGISIINLTDIFLPTEVSFGNAYPNPFNPTTTLSFAIPIDSEVSLSIYNLQGREVVSLINGNMEAGYHSVVWNADSHSSGVYFVKMVAGDYISTQKLMLVK